MGALGGARALHVHPTRYIHVCVWCVWKGGDNVWFVNTTAADVKSSRQKDTSICTCVHIILTNGGLQYMKDVSITVPSAPPSGQVDPPLLGKLLILLVWSKLFKSVS